VSWSAPGGCFNPIRTPTEAAEAPTDKLTVLVALINGEQKPFDMNPGATWRDLKSSVGLTTRTAAGAFRLTYKASPEIARLLR